MTLSGNLCKSPTRNCHTTSGETLSGNLSQFLPEIVRIRRRARGWPEIETSDTPSGATGKASAREGNEQCSERRSGQEVDR
jgi:hypothetical protein